MYCRKCGTNNADNAKFCEKCGAEMFAPKVVNKKASKSGKKVLLLSILAVVLLISIIVAVFIVSQKKKVEEYDTKLDKAERYLKEMNYDKAEATYLAAIKINPKNEEPYIKLAEIYSAQNEWENAKSILEQGIKETNSVKIKEKYSLYTYVENVLIPEVGTAKTGVYQWEFPAEFAGNKVKPIREVSGVITSRIMDFDNDGEDELLAAVLKNDAETEQQSSEHNAVYLEMYENEDGDVEKYDEILACDLVLGGLCNELSGIFLKKYEDKIYIVGGVCGEDVHGDYRLFSSFAMTYEDDEFQEYASTYERDTEGYWYGNEYRDDAEEMAHKMAAIGLSKTAENMRASGLARMMFIDDEIDILFQTGSENSDSSYQRKQEGGISNIHFWLGSEASAVLEKLPEASALEILEEYGFYGADEDTNFEGMTGASRLKVSCNEDTLKDMGDYYIVDASFYKQITVPANIQKGEKITLILNEITGEKETIICTENDEYGLSFGTAEYPDMYYTSGQADENGMLKLFTASYDAISTLIYEGELAIMKTATEEIAISNETGLFNPDTTYGMGWNCIYFNEKGYATRLVNYGD
ncbi:MAG: zinc-ribbon domain-containing protein [Schaedlerella sp.]|nr:zinc-ribbon domain-containing protein [Schaedlerella sp.]